MALTRTAPALALDPSRVSPNRLEFVSGALLWAALGVAFSPVLLTWIHSADLGSKHSYLLLVAVVLGQRIWRERRAARLATVKPGVLAIGLGIVLELLGILGETQFLMLLALPVAALGLALQRGWPSRGSAALAFFLVPIPDSVLGLASPGLEMGLASGAATLIGAFGSEVGSSLEAVGLSLVAGDAKLDLRPGNGGMLLAHLLAALGFARSVSAGNGFFASLRRAALFGASAVVLQPFGVVIAGGLVAAGSAELARLWLTHGLWCAVGLGAVAIGVGETRKKRVRSAD